MLALSCRMRKRVSLQRLVTLWVLSIGLLTGAFGLLYAYWHAKHSLRSTIGLTFLELAHQSADKVGLILEKEVEWVERLASTTDVVDAVTSGTGVAFDRPAFQRWRESQLRYFRSMVILDRQGRSVGGVISDVTRAHYNQQLWWPVVFEQRQIWVGELRSNEAGSGYWEVAVPITDRRGAVIGAIKVVIEKDQLFASVFRSRIGETGHVMLLTSRGLVLACPILPSTQHRVVQVEEGRCSMRPTPFPTRDGWRRRTTDMEKRAASSASRRSSSVPISRRPASGSFLFARIRMKPMRR